MADESAPGEYPRTIHSTIYQRLVHDQNDLIGLVAYGLYQAEKRRWIEQFEGLHHHLPGDHEIREFCFTYDDERLAKLQAESEELFFKATEARIEEQRADMVQYAFNARTTEELGRLRQAVDAKSGYAHHVLAHLLSFAILVGLYYFITFAATHEPTIAGFFTNKPAR